MTKLLGRTAVVTGAASGIGRALAEELAKRGAHLALADVDERGLEEAAAPAKRLGVRVSTHVVDVSNRDAMEALPEAVLDHHGAVHVVVNNAGVTATSTFLDQPFEDFDWVVGVNFWGVVHGCKFFLPHLVRQGEGHLVNVSSVFGFIGVPKQSSYCATKFAVRGLTETLRAELDGTGVQVSCVHPGGIATNIVQKSRTNDLAEKVRIAKMFEDRAMPPSECARQIAHGVEKNTPRILVTKEAWVIDGAKRLFPVWSSDLAVTLQKRFGL